MANVLSLALKVTADASGFKLDPIQRALVGLGTEADKLTSVFDKFKGASAAAGEAQEQAARKTQELINALRDGGSATEFAANFAKLTESVREQAAAFERGAEITKKYTSEESLRAQKIAELQRLLDQGAIKEDIYAAAVADVSGANAAAAEAEKQRAAAIAEAESQRQKLLSEGASLTERFSSAEEKRAAQLQRVDELLRQGAITEEIATRARAEFSGEAAAAAEAEKLFADQKAAAAKIIEANLSSVERAQKAYDAAVQQAQELERAGLLTKEQLNAEIARQAGILEKATNAADNNAEATAKQALKFNELSGIFAAIPGPLGDIAGRISGLSSAGEGLSRIFSGGLSSGFTALGSSITALINPFTLAVAGFAAFAAAAASVINGLTSLEDRVEKLGNTADKLGTSFEFVQVLDEAARRSGTSIDTVSAAFGRLQKSVTGVDEESKAAATALGSIGVTAEQLQALAPEEQYKLIGARLAEIEDPAKRSATATQLFGKSGAELLPFFNNLGSAADDMQRFGAAVSTVDRGRIDNLGNAFDDVFVALQGLGQSVLLPFAGLVEGIVKAFSGFINIVTAVAQAIGSVLGPVLDGIGAALGLVGDAINGTIGFFRSFFTTAEETSKATAGVADGIKRTAEEADALAKAFGESDKALNSAIDKAGEFGQAGFDAALKFQNAIQDLKDMADEGELNAEQYARGVANATAEYDRQVASIKKAQEETKRLAEEARRVAEAEKKRVDDLLALQAPIDKLAQDITATNNEIVRTEAALAAARKDNATADIESFTKRLAQLDQLQAKLADQSEEAALGFAEGFDKAFADVDKGVGNLIDKAAEFGNEGAVAASQLTEGIEKAKAAVKDGILNKEAFDAEVKRQKQLYEDRVKDLQEAAKITEKLYEKEGQLLEEQFKIRKEREEELAAIRTGSVKIDDIRSGGIDDFFNPLQQDPAIAEAKKQLKELEKIRSEISKLNAQKVDILTGTG